MDIKSILDLDRKILTYTLSGILVCGICFFVGRCSAPPPSKDDVCSDEMAKVRSRDTSIANLNERISLQKGQLETCEDNCGKRLGDQAKRKNTECDTLRAADVTRLKTRFTNYKCNQCKSEGLCK